MCRLQLSFKKAVNTFYEFYYFLSQSVFPLLPATGSCRIIIIKDQIPALRLPPTNLIGTSLQLYKYSRVNRARINQRFQTKTYVCSLRIGPTKKTCLNHTSSFFRSALIDSRNNDHTCGHCRQ